ncbi:Inorganic pyrophosphatase [Candidatus Lokiarchaeum ossiferum]|uniref:Inorganic pyrophosphatase n=1 Tax=Candidatus Lokiarchaeum ossiferum TaxID=2951803 RepID=A0ABY6HUW1_9ARCH|nr:Inorganic pyrophosphatase [Candidatus Lokiarchaeum sp. B-35]
MMKELQKYWQVISPGSDVPKKVNAIIECPKGTQNKYEMSKTTNLLKLDRVLHSSVIYPQDYGFIPGTYADDGDPLDILVLITHPTYPLVCLEVRPIGVLLMEDQNGVDEKILAVPDMDPIYKTYEDIVQLPQHYIDEIQEFFRTYKNLEEHSYSEVRDWKGRDYAHMIISKSVEAFIKKFGDIAKIHP